MPLEAGYHKLEVETWRPRGNLTDEIHSFFLGGSIRIQQLEEIIRTKYIDEKGTSDIVNRFGLETENSGKVFVNMNLCHQSGVTRKENRKRQEDDKQALLLETKKQVMRYKLRIKEQLEKDQNKKLVSVKKNEKVGKTETKRPRRPVSAARPVSDDESERRGFDYENESQSFDFNNSNRGSYRGGY